MTDKTESKCPECRGVNCHSTWCLQPPSVTTARVVQTDLAETLAGAERASKRTQAQSRWKRGLATKTATGGTKHDTLKPRFHLIPMEVWPAVWTQDISIGHIRELLGRWAGGDPVELHELIQACGNLLCPSAPETAMMHEVARVLAFGAQKYERDNWRKGFKWTRLSDGIDRHLRAYELGEVTDLETGMPHLAHACCGLLFLVTHIEDGLGEDDR